MDSSVIYDAIYSHFINYEYKLFNSYVYDWESDFFGISKTGYSYEVEVKISRSDYFVDFKKDKHELFKTFYQKKTHHIFKSNYLGRDPERLICEFSSPKIEFDYNGKEGGSKWRHYYQWRKGNKNGQPGYWANDYGNFRVYFEKNRIWAPATRIRIEPVSGLYCPHCFYYACPVGLIKISELPPYAGLLFIDEFENVTVIKKAPYLHKNKTDLTSRLLQKFYSLWQYKTTYELKKQLTVPSNL